MRILAFTDLHLSEIALKKIKWKTRLYRPELLICAGDITIFEEGLSPMLEKLNGLKKNILLIHGNHEDDTILKKQCEKYNNITFIHKTHYIHKQCLFLGYGGGGFSLVEKGFYQTGKKFDKIMKKHPDKKKVFVTHAPPYNTRVDLIVDHHCGNKTFRLFDIKQKIDVHICGHLHENFGKTDFIKNTKIINPGQYGKLIRI